MTTASVRRNRSIQQCGKWQLMNEADEQVPGGGKRCSTRRVAARLASVLDCEVGDNRQQTGQQLIAVTLAEPDGRVETLCLTLDDGSRLCRMLAAVQPSAQSRSPEPPPPQPQPIVASSCLMADSVEAVKSSGNQKYLQGLKIYAPDLAAYIEKQIQSLSSSVRKHCPSGPAARSLERRLVTALLVTADGARRHG